VEPLFRKYSLRTTLQGAEAEDNFVRHFASLHCNVELKNCPDVVFQLPENRFCQLIYFYSLVKYHVVYYVTLENFCCEFNFPFEIFFKKINS